MRSTENRVTIAVNATAARESGALTILKQFLEALENDRGNDRYVVFVPAGLELDVRREHIRTVAVDTRRWRERIAWDRIGFRTWLRQNGIAPDLIVSLQNTGVNYDPQVPQIVYYHQLLPLERFGWNPLKSSERQYFLYKHLYPLFVRRYLGRAAAVVVQRESLKALFAKKFGYASDRIAVLRPNPPKIDVGAAKNDRFRDGRIHFFYPAAAFVYKNHRVLVEAASVLKNRGLGDNIRIHLTLSEEDFAPLVKKTHEREVRDLFVFEGKIPFDEILSVYNSSSALLFPSYIETYGLPLSEAAAFGLPIVCSDLPYTHEVLEDYPGAEYVSYRDAAGWADAIERRLDNPRQRFPRRHTNGKGDWDRFIALCRETAIRK